MKKRKTDSLFWGVVLLVIGFVFLLENLGVDISIGEILKFWPVILIYFGGKALYEYFTQNNGEYTTEKTDENGETDEK
jgi:hypothetical protein